MIEHKLNSTKRCDRGSLKVIHKKLHKFSSGKTQETTDQLGCSSLSLLPLDFLHIELQFLAFQYVSDNLLDKLINKCKINYQHINLNILHRYLIETFQVNDSYPSTLPHWPGREEMEANNLPLLNCSSMWGSSFRPC